MSLLHPSRSPRRRLRRGPRCARGRRRRRRRAARRSTRAASRSPSSASSRPATSSRPISRAREAQAKKLGVDLRVFPGKQDPALERDQIEQAINLGVEGDRHRPRPAGVAEGRGPEGARRGREGRRLRRQSRQSEDPAGRAERPSARAPRPRAGGQGERRQVQGGLCLCRGLRAARPARRGLDRVQEGPPGVRGGRAFRRGQLDDRRERRRSGEGGAARPSRDHRRVRALRRIRARREAGAERARTERQGQGLFGRRLDRRHPRDHRKGQPLGRDGRDQPGGRRRGLDPRRGAARRRPGPRPLRSSSSRRCSTQKGAAQDSASPRSRSCRPRCPAFGKSNAATAALDSPSERKLATRKDA